ncbi:Carbamoyltransferase [Desulfatibacillum aliphaticivorans]|uniref:Carbamoyltransferase n=1 Tax=Desulfatibacillum aliphaticivorans TaxID=218208 RepID=B8FCH1_DESAL|nr:carbamoyltransferase [Desulfatibacillum aliphaticivorans]ACL06134.1 Carbamoyltransferase [Desulfatibacillum aliphaticivorans]
MNILGISAFYHDSAACLLMDGGIIAAAQEERFSRIKHDPGFPEKAVEFCLKKGGIKAQDLNYVVFYDKPFLTFDRLLMTALATAPFGLIPWLKAMPKWLGRNLHTPRVIKKKLGCTCPVLFTEHHEAHAAAAFYPSPFESAAILTMDGVGEWATASYGAGQGREISLFKEMHFPHSLGLLYSAFTSFCGFKVNSGEYKLMGLAPYGEPKYKDQILTELVDLKEDGSLCLNMAYFDYLSAMRMTGEKFSQLFDGPPRKPETEITRREMDLAASVQAVLEEAALKMAAHVHKETGEKNLCLAGGVALNCVANAKILRQGLFKNIWVQPAAGDAGSALGAALAVWHRVCHEDRAESAWQGPYLGPSFSNKEVRAFLEKNQYPFHRCDNMERAWVTAQHVAQGKIVGYMVGPMEFGPRALGARSILGDPRDPQTQQVMNKKIKFRESFRPFAPAVLEEKAAEYFDLDRPSPYMLFTAPLREDKRLPMAPELSSQSMSARLKQLRSGIPAVTHLDYSARVQTVSRKDKPDFYDVIKEFENHTGCPVIVNTSFNVRGEPIVCTPRQAYNCFMKTGMDVLVMENNILYKEEQPPYQGGRKGAYVKPD